MQTLALRFVKWGAALLILGLLSGYGPLAHYLSGGAEVACPWAPIHGHTALLGWVGMTLFGLVYRALPDWGTPSAAAVKLGSVHLWITVVAVLGVFANGIFGYRYLDRLSPGFYYKGDQATLRLWLSIDGAFLTLFAVGCALFLIVLFRTAKGQVRRGPADAKALVERYVEEVWNGGDPAALEALTTPDFRYYLGGQPGRDRAAMAEFLAATRKAFPDWCVRAVEIAAEGEMVAVRWRGEVTHRGPFHGIPPTGKRLTVSGINLYRLAADKVAAEWEETDSLGILRQLGAA